MSIEHQPHQPKSAESKNQLHEAAQERLKQLQNQEVSPDQPSEKRAEAAREALKQLDTEPDLGADASEHQAPPPRRVNFFDPQANFDHTMKSLQKYLSPVSRIFSKVIHNPVVDQSSEVLGKTVARPSVINGALWTALIVGGSFYLLARAYGYALSGSEMLFSLITGAIIGLVIEAIWRAYKHS